MTVASDRAPVEPGEIDGNFLLVAENGSRSVLKIAPSGTERAEIEGQLVALAHLAVTDLRDLVPGVVPDVDGRPLSSVTGPGGETHLVRMVTFLDGEPIAFSRLSTVAQELIAAGGAEPLVRGRLATQRS